VALHRLTTAGRLARAREPDMRNVTGLGVGLIALALLPACDRGQEAVEPPSPPGGAGPATAGASTGPEADEPAMPPEGGEAGTASVLACDGPLGRGLTRAGLVAEFGAANVRDGEEPGPEGMTYPATVVFPDDPQRRLIVTFLDSTEGPGGANVLVNETASQWRLPGGIGPGASVADVIAANGGDFRLGGLGWDYGGYVSDWRGGAFGERNGCSLQVRFGLADGGGGLDTAILGDMTIESSAPGLASATVVVSEIGIVWRKNGGSPP
jgi:hypothetical protein